MNYTDLADKTKARADAGGLHERVFGLATAMPADQAAALQRQITAAIARQATPDELRQRWLTDLHAS